MKAKAHTNEINLSLSRSKALVLFDFLSRFTEQKRLQICDQAEERVLWDIQADLERALPEPLSPDYAHHLKRARHAVRDQL
jgi:hypothetical protein